MAVKFTNEEIETLIKEAKPYHREALQPNKMKKRRGHKRSEIEIIGANGNIFVVKLRQSLFNHLDFSVILGVNEPGTTSVFRLRRYNGRSHEHRNKLTDDKFYDFHIHQATELYQAHGFDEDAYAEPTNRFSNLVGAINSMIADCGFFEPGPPKPSLFS